MRHNVDDHVPATRSRTVIAPAIHGGIIFGIIWVASVVALAGCGQSVAGSPAATPTPTHAPTATATATEMPTATATSAPAGSTCQPDDYSIYASQNGFVTNLGNAPLPAPPQTKHGIGSGGDNGSVIQAGESGMCTIGTFASVTDFYTQHLSSLGWQYSAPPVALAACFHDPIPAKVWWKGSDTFAWYDSGNAGGGSIFWSYTYCTTHV